MKKILVTGGAGLIGSNVVQELNQNGHENIIIVDHLSSSEKWKNLIPLKYLDYYEKDAFRKIIFYPKDFFKDISHVIHLGACSNTTEKDATYLIDNNYQYSKDLCEVSLANQAHFIYASSAATYGEGELGYNDEDDFTRLKPLNMYGYSKQMFDVYALKNNLLSQITGLKYFNVFGFGEFHKGDMRSVVIKGYEQIVQTGKLQLFKSYRSEYKDGEQKRDFLYVKDAAKITLYLLFNNHYGIYNIGRGIAETWNALANALFQALDKKVNIEYIDMPDYLKPKYQYYTKAETQKLQKTSYSLQFINLEDAIKDYVQKILLK